MDHALRVGYVGNFKPVHSTENHVRQALEVLGHQVVPYQEDALASWQALERVGAGDLDLLLWTRTWHLPALPQLAVLGHLEDLGVPTVAYHLDRWWGLDREHQVADEPMFRCRLVVTADGGHEARWVEAGVDHLWMPPAVLGLEAQLGTRRDRMVSDVAFVGSWAGYHAEWPHRRDLIGYLGRRYGRRFKVWPRGGKAVRGQDLRDLYASIRVAVGDSCMVPDEDGTPSRFYWSDRVPETLGRGALLLHPWTEGLDDAFDGLLPTWRLGRWTELRELIDRWVDDDRGRQERAMELRQLVLERHTYEVRMRDLIDDLDARGWLRG